MDAIDNHDWFYQKFTKNARESAVFGWHFLFRLYLENHIQQHYNEKKKHEERICMKSNYEAAVKERMMKQALRNC